MAPSLSSSDVTASASAEMVCASRFCNTPLERVERGTLEVVKGMISWMTGSMTERRDEMAGRSRRGELSIDSSCAWTIVSLDYKRYTLDLAGENREGEK